MFRSTMVAFLLFESLPSSLARDAPTVSRLEVLLDSRLGSGVKLSPNAEAGRPFTILLSCSTDYLMKRQAAYIAKGNKRSAKLDKCICAFRRCRADARQRQTAERRPAEAEVFEVLAA